MGDKLSYGAEMKKNRGFSAVGMLVAMVIVIALTAMFLKSFTGKKGKSGLNDLERAKQESVKISLRAIENAIEDYRGDNDVYPPTLGDLGGYLKGVSATDPWGNPYHYRCPGTYNVDSYDLASFGKDNVKGGSDENTDIKNW